jgi:hypothetical protein
LCYLTGPPERPQSFDSIAVTYWSITLSWIAGYNGGSTQTFDVQIKSYLDTGFAVIRENLADPGIGNSINININNLKKNYLYTFRVVAKNQYKGVSVTYSKEITIETTG